MAGGRPTVYNQEVLDNALYYLKNYEEYGCKVPTVVGLCGAINRSKTTVYRWEKEEGKEQFRDILEQISESQECGLINKGLSGDFNSAITKMMLTKHGYSDKMDIDQDTNLTVNIVEFNEDDE